MRPQNVPLTSDAHSQCLHDSYKAPSVSPPASVIGKVVPALPPEFRCRYLQRTPAADSQIGRASCRERVFRAV